MKHNNFITNRPVINKVLYYIALKKISMKTPVLHKVQGKMAEVLKKESWPSPREGEVTRKRKSWRNEKEIKICK